MGLFNQLVVDSEDDKKKLEQIAFATDEPLAVASTFNRGLSAYYLNAHERAINEFGKVINQDPTFSQAFLFRRVFPLERFLLCHEGKTDCFVVQWHGTSSLKTLRASDRGF
jgi:hypothetical protein